MRIDEEVGPPGHVHYTIDGRPFSGPKKQRADKLLRQAGLDSNEYDLAQLHCDGEAPDLFDDSEFVKIEEGDRFVSVREKATVA